MTAPALARLGIGLLLAVKLLITGWNCHAYSEKIYDQRHHAWRARTGGLEVTWLSYNGPVYYLPVLAAERVAGPLDDEQRLVFLRWTNLLHLAVTYGLWVFFLFPRLLPGTWTWTLASVVLLALPGFQKLAAMVHPDNLLVSSCTVSLALWLVLRERLLGGRGARAWLLGAVALSLATLGLSRPFALAPVVVIWAAVTRELVRGKVLLARAALVPVVAVGMLAALPPVAWQADRYLSSGRLTNVYGEKYMARFRGHLDEFDHLRYLTSFYFPELVRTPNRTMNAGWQPRGPAWENPYANSLPTLLYSETWGDHWLSFSGQHLKDGKVPAKSRLLRLALPGTILLILAGLAGSALVLARARRTEGEPAAWILALVVSGIALFLWWQLGPALLPGKNSTVKFIYVAYLFPPALVLCFQLRPPRWLAAVLLAYGLAVYAAAWPVALWRPL